MHTKLTLRLDNAMVDLAKTYASKRNTSISQLVSGYFAHLSVASKEKNPKIDLPVMTSPPAIPITSITHQLSGALSNIAAQTKSDKVEYFDYLDSKHH